MRFLITNIGNEEIVLGYPWLAAYEPKFNWKYATINETILPVVLRSVNPNQAHRESIIAHTNSEKEEVIRTLESQCMM